MTDTTVTTGKDTLDDGTLERLRSLGADVERLRSGPEWTAWLTTAAKFHHYSFTNQFLIYVQRPEATLVAGYNAWQQKHRRQVRKGEKGIRICAPIARKQDNGTERVVAFKVVSVFDVSQTDGEDLPVAPTWPMAGGEPTILFDQLAEHCATAGLKVSTTDVQGASRGWCIPAQRTIVVRSYLPAATQVAVLLHELGHCFDPDVTTDRSRPDKEVVAESVAWIVGSKLGLELDDQVTHYLASWEGSAKDLLRVGRRIVAAVKAIEGEVIVTTERKAA